MYFAMGLLAPSITRARQNFPRSAWFHRLKSSVFVWVGGEVKLVEKHQVRVFVEQSWALSVARAPGNVVENGHFI